MSHKIYMPNYNHYLQGTSKNSDHGPEYLCMTWKKCKSVRTAKSEQCSQCSDFSGIQLKFTNKMSALLGRFSSIIHGIDV